MGELAPLFLLVFCPQITQYTNGQGLLAALLLFGDVGGAKAQVSFTKAVETLVESW